MSVSVKYLAPLSVKVEARWMADSCATSVARADLVAVLAEPPRDKHRH